MYYTKDLGMLATHAVRPYMVECTQSGPCKSATGVWHAVQGLVLMRPDHGRLTAPLPVAAVLAVVLSMTCVARFWTPLNAATGVQMVARPTAGPVLFLCEHTAGAVRPQAATLPALLKPAEHAMVACAACNYLLLAAAHPDIAWCLLQDQLQPRITEARPAQANQPCACISAIG
jgi:hypothetical protein